MHASTVRPPSVPSPVRVAERTPHRIRNTGAGRTGARRAPRVLRAVLTPFVALHVATAPPAAAQSATASPADAARTAEPPRLVVLLTVDQLRPDYLPRFETQLDGGLARLWRDGAVFTNATHDHATTETAPGHATLGSGRFPRHTGIVRNEAGVQDPQTPLVGGARGGGASPFRFRGSSLFDWIRARDPWARGLSVSRKDRGAILPMGRAQQPVFWYSADGRFVTSTYYADTLPDWVTAFNASGFTDRLAGGAWTLLRDAADYPEPDSVATESGGRDFTFPHAYPEDARRRAASLGDYPVMDSLTLAFALAGVNAMQLGGNERTEFLAVSLSTTDAVGHRYGPDSRELHDQVLRVDRWLGQFMDSLAALRGADRVVYALSADHGVAPFPELRFPGDDPDRGRVAVAPLVAAIGRDLVARGGSADLVEFESGLVLVHEARLRAVGLDPDSLTDAVAARFAALPGVMRVDRREQLAALAERGDVLARRWLHAIPDDLPVRLTVTLAPYYYLTGYRSATHGSPHDYDARVPLIFLGAPFTTGRYDAPARTVDLAATMAAAIGVVPIEPIDGRPLVEALRAAGATAP